ncbi:MAG: hypothetical protein ACQERI_09340 [Candidatus Krumholzibacteriota bacterium]
MIKKLFICLVVICLSVLMLSCIEDNRVAGPEADNSLDWPDRSLKEDCVDIMVLSLVRGSSVKYRELLLKPDTTGVFPEGFIWYSNQNNGEENLPPLLDYNQDVEAVDLLLSHAIDFRFKIDPGNWYPRDFFRGSECADCWESTRGYILLATLDNGEAYSGMFRLNLVIGPDPENSGKFVIYEAADLPRAQLAAAKRPADVEGVSLSRLKNIVKEKY